jgi:hypothetical protein
VTIWSQYFTPSFGPLTAFLVTYINKFIPELHTSTLKMEAECSCETAEATHKTTRCHNQKEQILIMTIVKSKNLHNSKSKRPPTYNTGILHIPYDNSVSAIVSLHPTCNPIKREVTLVNIQKFITSYPPRKEPDQSDQYTREITNIYIYIYINLNFDLNLTFNWPFTSS